METTQIRPPGYSPGPYTWDDFIALDEDDTRELIDGHLIEVEVPNKQHEYIVGYVIIRVGSWALERNAGRTFASGYKVQVTDTRGIMPDVQFFKTGHVLRNAQQGLAGDRPDLAVEVISPSSRSVDRVTKLNWYASIGVPEYWLIDPEGRTLERFVLSGSHYIDEPHGQDELFGPDTFPGLTINLADLWVDPDGQPAGGE